MSDPDGSDTDADDDPDEVAGRSTDVGDAGAFGNDETEVVEWSDVYDSEEETGDTAAGSPSGDATPDGQDATAGDATGTGGSAAASGPSVPANAGAGESGPTTGADAGATQGVERGPNEKFCRSCGAVIKEAAVVCPECGVEQEGVGGTTSVEVSTGTGGSAESGGNDSDPGVAALLSGIGLLIPVAAGAGQIYNGEVGKGVLFSIIQFINVFLVFLLVGIVTYPLFGVFAIYDAYKNADG